MRRRQFLAACGVLPFVGTSAEFRARSSAAMDKGARYLIKQQQADGSWTSDVYGIFKDGRGLSPLMVLALIEHGKPDSAVAVDKAKHWLWANIDTLADVFPVHNASWLLQAGAVDKTFQCFRTPMVDRLRSLQLESCGGWGYAPQPPAPARALAPFEQANLAATTLAITGLRSACVGCSDPALQEALRFIQGCQNLPDSEESAHSEFDDGGFFQMPGDPSRNKAGRAGKDTRGRLRMRSYTSATADGLSALLLCDQSPTDTRVLAAMKWLHEQADLADVPDLRHLTGLALASLVKHLPSESKFARHLCRLCQGLVSIQKRDGSWHNNAGEMREDDPLVATAMTVIALVRLRKYL